jgi:hypothetical protein
MLYRSCLSLLEPAGQLPGDRQKAERFIEAAKRTDDHSWRDECVEK